MSNAILLVARTIEIAEDEEGCFAHGCILRNDHFIEKAAYINARKSHVFHVDVEAVVLHGEAFSKLILAHCGIHIESCGPEFSRCRTKRKVLEFVIVFLRRCTPGHLSAVE